MLLRRLCFLLLGFSLAAFSGPQRAAAQEDDQIFAVVDYVKTVDAFAFEEAQTFIWQPIYQLRVEAGELVNWALYKVAFGDKSQYDYVEVRLVRGFDRAMKDLSDVEPLLERAQPAMTLAELDLTRETRTVLRTEIWVQDDVASIPAGPFEALEVNFMEVSPGQGSAYIRHEREVWRPIHEYVIEQGQAAGWGVYQLVFPGGADQPFNFATVSMRNSWNWSSYYRHAASIVHETMSWDEIVTRTQDLRVMRRSETWNLVAITEAGE